MDIRFDKTLVPSANGSMLAAVDYLFYVDGRLAFVRMFHGVYDHLTAAGFGRDEVQQAAEALLRLELEKGVDVVNASPITMNDGAMMAVASRLGWFSRLYKSANSALS